MGSAAKDLAAEDWAVAGSVAGSAVEASAAGSAEEAMGAAD